MDNSILNNEIYKLQQGDYSSYQTFYEESSRYLYPMILRIIPNTDEAYAVLTDAYNRIYAQINQLTDYNSFYIWAGRIVTDCTLSYITSNGNIANYINTGLSGNSPFPYERALDDNTPIIPESLLSNLEYHRIIDERIASLPAIQQLILQYFYYEGLTKTEIAARLQTEATYVASMLAGIRDALSDVINGFNINPNEARVSIASIPFLWIVYQNVINPQNAIVATAAVAAAGIAGAGSAGGVAGSGASAGAVGVGGASGVAESGAVGVGVAGSGATGVGVAGSGASTGAVGTAGGVIGTAGTTGGAVGTSAAVGTAAAAKAGLGIGVKIAIGVGATAVAVGGGIGAKIAIDKSKEKNTTEITSELETEITTEEISGSEEETTVEVIETNYISLEDALEAYRIQYEKDEGTHVSLIYLDDNEMPEMVYYNSSNYYIVYTYTENGLEQVNINPADTFAAVYGINDEIFYASAYSFYPFEYVERGNKIRIHHYITEQNDYYINLAGEAQNELTAVHRYEDYGLNLYTYKENAACSNEDFLTAYDELGYSQLKAIDKMYEDVDSAYSHMADVEDAQTYYTAFGNSEISAVQYISGFDGSEPIYETLSYSQMLENSMAGELYLSYFDYDSDGTDEMIITGGYGDSWYILDVYNSMLCVTASGGGTADSLYYSNSDDGIPYIAHCDTGHQGRQYHLFYRYDSCGNILDRFELNAEYWETTYYDENSDFYYRGNSITMEEYEQWLRYYNY